TPHHIVNRRLPFRVDHPRKHAATERSAYELRDTRLHPSHKLIQPRICFRLDGLFESITLTLRFLRAHMWASNRSSNRSVVCRFPVITRSRTYDSTILAT